MRTGAALGFAALSPLLLGSVMLSRFDLWPRRWSPGSLAAFVAGRNRVGAGVLGLAVAAKLFPAVLVPHRRSLDLAPRAAAARRSSASASSPRSSALVFLPFVVLAPHGVWHSVTTQTSRPLQIETLGAGVLLVAHAVGGLGITMRPSHGSQNLAGSAPDALAVVQTILQAAALLATWIWFARGPVDARAARPRVGDGGLRVRRLRQGALAAVPDLADPARAARPRPARARRRARCWRRRSCSRRSGSRSATGTSRSLRPDRVVARPRPRPRRWSRCSRSLLVAPTVRLGDAQRLDRRSAAVGVAVDDDALEADAALGGPEADGHARCACAGSPARPRRRSPSRAGRSSRRR